MDPEFPSTQNTSEPASSANKTNFVMGAALLGMILLVGIVIAVLNMNSNKQTDPNISGNNTIPTEKVSETLVDQIKTEKGMWEFNGEKWSANGIPPECPNPLTIESPVDLLNVAGILYPGQTRNAYKPHGGFIFEGITNEEVTVTAPMDAQLVSGSRYIEQGEVQYLLFFVNPCGIAYRFDHLLTLSKEMQLIANTLPEPKIDDSRTTRLISPVPIKTGDIIATAVGFKNNQNVSVDFGVYDLRNQNESAANPEFAAAHITEKEQAYYGVCWLDWLSAEQSSEAKKLPGGDSFAGKTSDYCK